MLIASLAVMAIVTQDQAALRAAPRDSAQQQAVLWQGESLEIRGEKADYLQVYDHRLERGGYIRASQVRTTTLDEMDAPQLLSVVRFLRDAPGAESLGIAYAAAYLKAAPAKDISAEPFDALGTMADRLAHQASVRQGKASDPALAGHLDVVAGYGVTMQSFEHNGRMQLCYEGEAFRRVLALPATDEQKARAALALTRNECVDPATPPAQRVLLDKWRADVLERATSTNLPDYMRNRLHMRRAGVWSAVAFEHARRGEPAVEAGSRALDELAAVNKAELTDEDATPYTDAAVRVGATRWATESVIAGASKGLHVATTAGQPGETCVLLVDAQHDEKAPLLKRCTYGVVWTASARANPGNTALTLAVQPLDAWRELWVFRKQDDGWIADVVPPSADPDVGYVEFAGWVPGGKQMLAAREIRVDGRFKRSFETINLGTLEVDRHADKPVALSAFYRWQDPAWKRITVSMR